jgi:hypothetical protein
VHFVNIIIVMDYGFKGTPNSILQPVTKLNYVTKVISSNWAAGCKIELWVMIYALWLVPQISQLVNMLTFSDSGI